MGRALTSLFVLLSLCAHAPACFWDNDVYFDDQNGPPTLQAILAGQWEQHSEFFYDELIRLENGKKHVRPVAGKPYSPPIYTVLAVAYTRRGNLDDAIATLKERAAWENPKFHSEAIYGTVCLAQGDVDAGIEHLKAALELHRNDETVRENVELMLAKHLKATRADPTLALRDPTFVRPMMREAAGLSTTAEDSSLFAVAHRANPEIDHAILAIAMMVRFGNPAGPQLYAALGDLLRFRGDDALAFRAFRRALEAGHPSPAFVRDQLEAIRHHVDDSASIDEVSIRAERDAADAWVVLFQAFEEGLLRAGKDVYAVKNYDDFYRAHGTGREVPRDRAAEVAHLAHQLWKPIVLALMLIAVAVAMLVQGIRAKRLTRVTSAD